MGFLSAFVFKCCHGPDECEAGGTIAQVEQAVQELEQGEHASRAKKRSLQTGERSGEHEGGEEHTAKGEHEGGGSEHTEEGEGEEEESGPRISLDGIHDEILNGSRLVLSFDKESSTFVGTVENLTEQTLARVRIEVHLSNGIELGPTEPIDLAPGTKAEVKLSAEGIPSTGGKPTQNSVDRKINTDVIWNRMRSITIMKNGTDI